jgi:hypothetical protein
MARVCQEIYRHAQGGRTENTQHAAVDSAEVTLRERSVEMGGERNDSLHLRLMLSGSVRSRSMQEILYCFGCTVLVVLQAKDDHDRFR